MRNEDNLQPFLVGFPLEDGGRQLMLDPNFFSGADEVGVFLAELARHYARAFVQSGRARGMDDAIEQIRELWDIELDTPIEDGDEEGEDEDD